MNYAHQQSYEGTCSKSNVKIHQGISHLSPYSAKTQIENKTWVPLASSKNNLDIDE